MPVECLFIVPFHRPFWLASQALLQVTAWVLAFLIVLVPIDTLRFLSTAKPPPMRLLEIASSHDTAAQMTSSAAL